MRWYALHHELATNLKWMALPMDLRGAWITLLTIAAASDPRGRLRDRATAEALIKREMQPDDYTEPAYYVGELIDRGWIDAEEDGTLTFHDFDYWQRVFRKPSDLPEATRNRKQEQRARERGREQDMTEEDKTSHDTGRSAGARAVWPFSAAGARLLNALADETRPGIGRRLHERAEVCQGD